MNRAITQKMDMCESNIEKQFTNLYCKRDFEYQLKLAQSAAVDRQPFVLRKLAQMINDIGGECEYGKTLAYYKKLIASLKIPANTNELNKKLIETLCSTYAFYPQPEDFMRRIVDSLDSESAMSASLQLRILRKFLKTVNVKENKKYYSKSLAKSDINDIDESIFDVLNEAPKEKCDYLPLLQGCYNLAKGKFISPSTTKELLFLFALAYDMRYYSDDSADKYDVSRDIVKNLFVDYYCDNLARYIFFEDGGKTGSSDTEPSGIGLNPKNFIDVVFIYYLNNETLDTNEKVSRFFSMINKVKDSWKKEHDLAGDVRLLFESIPTSTYRSKLNNTIQSLREEDLERYILDNYYCDVRYTYANKKTGELQQGSKGLFELQFSTNTAYTQYCEILDLIKEVLDLPAHTDFSRIDRRIVKDVATGEAFDKIYSDEDNVIIMRVSELAENVPEADLEYLYKLTTSNTDLSKFFLIMKNIEKRLNPYDAIGISNATEITRTKMIAAYYHYYCLENENGLDVESEGIWTSFKDVYEDMSDCLNAYLEDAGYQRISSKNLYDVFVIFFAYCKINNFLN